MIHLKKPTALIILDGWGYRPDCKDNAVCNADTSNFDRIAEANPTTYIGASGMDVGLPDGQMGNSEVGHLNIGAGRVIYQPLTRITKSIKDGDFFTKPELKGAADNVKKHNSKLHIFGLLSDGGVHSHIEHLKGIIDFAKQEGLTEVYLHAFLDGRDTPPKSALGYFETIEKHMSEVGVGRVATVSGRYYAMDRDNRWERVELAYNALVKGEGETASTAKDAVETSYATDKNDEFVLPTVIQVDGKPMATVGENDSVLFFNFRPDRARELTRSIVDVEFAGFKRDYFETHYVCMTQYDATIKNVEVVYRAESITNTLGEYLGAQGKTQLRIAETEKYAHVTFFFNGGVEEPYPGEERSLVPSPSVATYDMKPEMSANEVTESMLSKLEDGHLDFIVLNYANPDMVGHTGDFKAAKTAVETVDVCLGKVVDKIVSMGGKAIITADHGNAEEMVDYVNGGAMTAHTTNVVPCIVVGQEGAELREGGKLCDLAPTLLQMMDMEVPAEMTGSSIIK